MTPWSLKKLFTNAFVILCFVLNLLYFVFLPRKCCFSGNSFIIILVTCFFFWPTKLLRTAAGPGSRRSSAPLVLVVPKLPSGRAQDCAQAVLTALEDWELEERVRGPCFDTTAVNSGLVNGACTLIEEKLDQPVLHLACRHHVYKLVLKKAFSTSLGVSSGPTSSCSIGSKASGS